jgi:hypothetical protein
MSQWFICLTVVVTGGASRNLSAQLLLLHTSGSCEKEVGLSKKQYILSI